MAIILIVPMFLSFNFNFFHAVNPEKFYLYQSDSEALVIGRLVKSEKDGIFSSQGRMGRYYNLDGDDNRNQTKLYLGTLQGGQYEEYNSQIGLQGIILSHIDKLFEKLDINKDSRLDIYHAMASLLTTLTFFLILLILYKDIGAEALIVLFISLLLSKWQVYAAKNLYWTMFSFYLPMLTVFVCLKLEESGKRVPVYLIATMVYLALLLRSSMGYEYITSTLLATVTPLVYYSVKNTWARSKLINRMFIIGIAGLLGFFSAIGLHVYQLNSALGSYQSAFDTIGERVLARTQTEPDRYKDTPYYDSQTASVFYVLYTQLIKGGSFRLKIPFLVWILLSAHITNQLVRKRNYTIPGCRPEVVKALIVSTWFSLLAPLSWFILAKSHTYIHKDINNVVWHMPFMLFCMALAGLYWKPKIQHHLNKWRTKLPNF